eukprot:UN25630
MALFGKDGCGYLAPNETQEEEDAQCDDDRDKVNFSNWPLAMGLLYRVGTGDGWTDMYQYFLSSGDYDTVLIYFYFTTFFVVGTLVLINLFIAVILDVFEDNNQDAKQEKKIRSVFSWRDEWRRFDPKATGKITAAEFLETVLKSQEPAGLGGVDKITDIKVAKYLQQLHLLTTNESDKDDDFVENCCIWVSERVSGLFDNCRCWEKNDGDPHSRAARSNVASSRTKLLDDVDELTDESTS